MIPLLRKYKKQENSQKGLSYNEVTHAFFVRVNDELCFSNLRLKKYEKTRK
jgi:hypothetical protein